MTPARLEAGRTNQQLSPGLFLALLLPALGLLVWLAFAPGVVRAETNVRQAGLVARLSENEWVTRCVSFDEEQISGYELLLRSGLALEVAFESMGVQVCGIEGVGCSQADCLCQCRGGGECVYWSYWQLRDEGWRYARVGAAAYRLGHGDVDGWAWGPGTVTEAPQPPPVTFAEICPDAAAPPSPLESGELLPATPPAPEAAGSVAPPVNWQTYLPLFLILSLLLFLLVRAQRKRYD